MHKKKKDEKCNLKHQREGKVWFAINQSFQKKTKEPHILDAATSSSSFCCTVMPVVVVLPLVADANISMLM